MKLTKTLAFSLLSIFILNSCNPEDDESGQGYNGTPNNFDLSSEFGSQVSRDFVGQVTDVENNVVKNAFVNIGSTTVQTDDNGMFVINNAGVFERFATIKVTKSGYFAASRTVVPGTGKNLVKITLITSDPIAVFSSGSRTAVMFDSGTKVIFDGNFVEQGGASYSGSVRVPMAKIQPGNLLATQMPGMLYGADENGEAKVMNTYGMVNVEIRGAANQTLELEEENTAEITINIENSMLSSAPSSIPMWYFDHEAGYWRQEGFASKRGSSYVGIVNHFTWWNFGQAFDPVVLSGSVVTDSGNPLQNTTLSVSSPSVGLLSAPGFAVTDNNGKFRTMVAAEDTFNFNTTAFCPGSTNSFPLGPFTADTTLDAPLETSGNAIQVQGSVVNCNAANVTSGYVLISNGTQTTFAAVSNGNFNFSVPECTVGGNMTLNATDFQNEKSTGPIKYAVAGTSIAAGALQICTTNGFISYKIDNNPVVYFTDIFANLSFGMPEYNVYIRGDLPGQGSVFTLYGLTTVGGIFNTNVMQLNMGSFAINQDVTNTVVFNFSNFAAVGQYVDLTFNGTFVQSGVTHTVSGTIHVRRSN